MRDVGTIDSSTTGHRPAVRLPDDDHGTIDGIDERPQVRCVVAYVDRSVRSPATGQVGADPWDTSRLQARRELPIGPVAAPGAVNEQNGRGVGHRFSFRGNASEP